MNKRKEMKLISICNKMKIKTIEECRLAKNVFEKCGDQVYTPDKSLLVAFIMSKVT
jgi:hypothetical protein